VEDALRVRVRDNGWAISVPNKEQCAQPISPRRPSPTACLPSRSTGNDVLASYELMHWLVVHARSGAGPALLVVKTYRMLGHSSSDDPTKYRDKAEVERGRGATRSSATCASSRPRRAWQGRARRARGPHLYAEIDRVVHEQEAAPPMPLRSLVEDVYAEVPRHLRLQYNEFARVAERHGEAQKGDGAFPL
jgi:pyruvate dehydrogenase E1 component alpha subunit